MGDIQLAKLQVGIEKDSRYACLIQSSTNLRTFVEISAKVEKCRIKLRLLPLVGKLVAFMA